ncbi:MAG: 50S ribosomal protein L5 [bacterium]
MNRLMDKYRTELAAGLQKDLGYTNVHQTPKLIKIVVSVGVGRAVADQKYLDNAVATLRKLTGQQPIVTKAKNSIAGFKLREGNDIGAKVTLRGERMYDFLDRLVSVVLPRIRDFHGLSAKAFDRAGNYSIGLPEHTVFPEISYEESNQSHGLQITLVTTATDPQSGEALMRALGVPLERKEQ